MEDKEGRYLAIEILLEGKKNLVVGIYAPNGPKEIFFTKVKNELDELNFEQIILMGDFNGVNDKQKDKYPVRKRGKLPKTFMDMIEQEQLVDVWRNWNPQQQKFTYYSASKKALSRIDMIWVSKTLEVRTAKTEILPKVISDHNPVLWAIKPKQSKIFKWKLNEDIFLSKENIEYLNQETKNFFEINWNKEVNEMIVWEQYKAYMRGVLTSINIKEKF